MSYSHQPSATAAPSTRQVDGADLSEAAADLVTGGVVPHVIDGERRLSRAGGERAMVNPSTGNRFGTVTDGEAADVDAAVRAAREAFEDGRWRRLTPRVQEERLHRLADLIEEHAGVIGDLDALDAGILRRYASFIAHYSASSLRYFAGWPTKLGGSLPPVGPDYVVQERIQPVGVMGVIKPWNGPAAIFAQVAPALAAGNSVVLKPAEHTPLSATYMALLALEAGIPPGVFNVVHGDRKVGEPLVSHPGVNRLSFTGSVTTGRALAAAAAQTFKRVNLELGGKSPVLVFPDADIESAVAAASRSVWNNSGQVCTAGTRTLVHRSIYEDFVAATVEVSRDLAVGNAFDPTSELGPLITPEQLGKVRGYIEAGSREGASLRFEGKVDADGGNYQGPVIFADVRNDMTIAREEIFGPVLSILPFDDVDEAIAVANDSDYGLGGAVWSQNLSTALRVVHGVHTGTMWVNCYGYIDPLVGFGGTKRSGYGSKGSAAHMDTYLYTKSVYIQM